MANTQQGICGTQSAMAWGQTPGTMGINDAGDPNLDISLAGDTGGPIGTNRDQGAQATTARLFPQKGTLVINCLAFDQLPLVRFLRSVAVSVTLDKLTVVKGGAPVPDHNTGPFKTIDQYVIAAVAGEKTVEPPDQQTLDKASFDLASTYMQQFVVAMQKGGLDSMSFLSDLQAKKDIAIAAVQNKFKDAKNYNETRVQAFQMSLTGLAALKFGATVTVKTLGAFAKIAPPVSFAIETSYDVIVKSIESSSARDAHLVGVTEEAGKEGLKDWGEDKIKDAANKPHKEYVEELQKTIKKAREQIESGRLNSKKTKHAKKVLSRAEAQLAKASKWSAPKKLGGASVKTFFWVKDVKEAWQKLQEDLELAE